MRMLVHRLRELQSKVAIEDAKSGSSCARRSNHEGGHPDGWSGEHVCGHARDSRI